MSGVPAFLVYFAKVAVASFVVITISLVVIGIGVSLFTQGSSVQISLGAVALQGEDYLWIGVASVALAVVATLVRAVRR